MIVLQPINTIQTISVMTRYYNNTEQIDAVIRLDGDGDSETLTGLTVTQREYYLDIQLASSILKDGRTCTINMTSDGNLFYRDKIYVTSQNDYSVKHELSQVNYTEYNETDDNTYIIR